MSSVVAVPADDVKSTSGSRPASGIERRPSLSATYTVTKTVRHWSVDHGSSADKENDDENPAGAEPEPSTLVSGSSAMPSHLVAEQLVRKGLKRLPSRSQTMTDFWNSVTHLHLEGKGLAGSVEPLKLCVNLQVLYLYDNKLTSLCGLGGLKKLTHLYAQDNELETLEDFTAPPGLQQLFLNGNRLTEVCGLEQTRCLTELHLAGQRRPALPPPQLDWALGAPPPPDAAALAPPAPLSFDRESLYALSPTLRVLDVSGCQLDDDAVELFVVFQELGKLLMARNSLREVERLQQLVSRMPRLQTLSLKDNPLLARPKCRERIILASSNLEELDGKQIHPHERQFLTSMVSQPLKPKGPPRGGGGSRAPTANFGAGSKPGSRDAGGRAPSIDHRSSRPLPFEGLANQGVPGMRPGSVPPTERGARGAALPNSRSAASSSGLRGWG